MPDNNSNKRARSPQDEGLENKRPRRERRSTSLETDYGSFTLSDLDRLDRRLGQDAVNPHAPATRPTTRRDLTQGGSRGNSERAASETDYGSFTLSELDRLDRQEAVNPSAPATRPPLTQGGSRGDSERAASETHYGSFPSISLETDYGSRHRLPERALPRQEVRRSFAVTGHGRGDKRSEEEKPFSLKRPRDRDYTKYLLNRIDQPQLADPPIWGSGLPILAQRHQVWKLRCDDRALLSDEDLAELVDTKKSELYIIHAYRDGRGHYRKLPAVHAKTFNPEDQRHLGVLPDWKLTDRVMLELGLLEEDQVAPTPTKETQSSRSESRLYGERLARANSPTSSTDRMRASASVSHRSDTSSDSDAPLPVHIPIGMGQLKQGHLGPNFSGWTPLSIRHHWLPKLPEPKEAAERDEIATHAPNAGSGGKPPLRGLDKGRDRQRQGRG